MSCPRITMPAGRGDNLYRSLDPTIVAGGYALNAVAACGRELELCGPAACIQAYRLDLCPGCDAHGMVDLSEAGVAAVCGNPSGCEVTVRLK